MGKHRDMEGEGRGDRHQHGPNPRFSGVPSKSAAQGDDLKCRPFALSGKHLYLCRKKISTDTHTFLMTFFSHLPQKLKILRLPDCRPLLVVPIWPPLLAA